MSLVTGDRRSVAESIAKQLGGMEVTAEDVMLASTSLDNARALLHITEEVPATVHTRVGERVMSAVSEMGMLVTNGAHTNGRN